MDKIFRKNFEMSFIKNNEHKKVNNVNCKCQIFKQEISPTFSFKFLSVEKYRLLKRVKKFKK